MLRTVCCAVLLTIAASAAAARVAPAETPVDLQWGVKMPPRDGMAVQGALYRPQCQREDARTVTVEPRHDALHPSALNLLLAAERLAAVAADKR